MTNSPLTDADYCQMERDATEEIVRSLSALDELFLRRAGIIEGRGDIAYSQGDYGRSMEMFNDALHDIHKMSARDYRAVKRLRDKRIRATIRQISSARAAKGGGG